MDSAEAAAAYQSLSTAIYGIVSRIVQNETLAQTILVDVFVCLEKQNLLRQQEPWNSAALLPVVFSCVTATLSLHFPMEEVERRISAERARMLEYLRTQRG